MQTPTRTGMPSSSLSCAHFPALASLSSTTPANLASISVHAGGVLDSPLVMHHRLGLALVSQPTLPPTASCLTDIDNRLLAAHLTDRVASTTQLRPPYHTDTNIGLFYGQDFILDNEEFIGLASLPLLPQLSPQWRTTPIDPSQPDMPELTCPDVGAHGDSGAWLCDGDRLDPGSARFQPCSLPSPPESPIELDMSFNDSISPSHRPRVITASEEPSPLSAPLSADHLETDVITEPVWQPPADALSPPLSSTAPSLPPTSSDMISSTPPKPIPAPFQETSEPISESDSLDLPAVFDLEEIVLDPISTSHRHASLSPSYEPPIPTFLDPPSSTSEVTQPLLPSTVPLAQSPSPSRRTFASLPELDIPDDFPSPIYNPTPPTHHYLRSLPGAETDDELILSDDDPDLDIPPYVSHDHHHSPNSLLLIHDPNDIPLPRSPSPENFTIEPNLDSLTATSDALHSDLPDLLQVCLLQRRVNANERAARAQETKLLTQGNVYTRAEVRRTRKREKERGRELSALLRLKLGDKTAAVWLDDQGSGRSNTSGASDERPPNKKIIGSLAQLVARMVFRRREATRALANRTTPTGTQREYVPSPLSRMVLFFDDEDDNESEDNHEDFNCKITNAGAHASL